MKKIAIVTLLLITFFTGCNQTPSTTVINNMSTQDNKNEETESVDINELSQILIYEEAKAIADETLSRIGVTELEFDRCLYEEECLQITPEGALSTPLGDDLYVFYVQKLQGVPVRTALLSQRKK